MAACVAGTGIALCCSVRGWVERTKRMQGKKSLALGVLAGIVWLAGLSARAGGWWDEPVLKYKKDTGYNNASGSGPHFWNKDESDQYLFCPVGFNQADGAVLYSIPALMSASSADQVAPIVSGISSNFSFGGWKGGAVSDDLGRILTGNGSPAANEHASLPVSSPWTKGVNVFAITNEGASITGVDGMDFSHDSSFLYSDVYNPSTMRGKIMKWNVVDLGGSGIGLTSNSIFTTSLSRVRNVDVRYIGGRDLVFYGEGNNTAGGKVCVWDTVAGTETFLVSNGIPAGTANDIMNVKVSGVELGRMHLAVQCDTGSVYVYTLGADGTSGVSLVKSFTSQQMQALLGASWPNMRAFEVSNDGTHAFVSHHMVNTTNNVLLYVLWTPRRNGTVLILR